MNNTDLNRFNSAKSFIKSKIDWAVKSQTQPQHEILQACHDAIKSIYGHNKQTPEYLGMMLRSYLDGYFDASVKGKTAFLYKIDDVFYCLEKDVKRFESVGIKPWNTLPQEQWGDLGKYGGQYWADTLNEYFVK